MTLVITEVSDFGIVMVADSAVTTQYALPSGIITSQVLQGVQKLQAIPNLDAGISVWGLGDLEINQTLIPIDVWLSDYIRHHDNIQSIDEFANTLTHDIQEIVGETDEPMGFHLAGYVEQDGQRTPTVYHIRNHDGDSTNIATTWFIPGLELAASRLSSGDIFTLRNGDYGPYAILSNAILKALSNVNELEELEIPHGSLDGHIEYHRAWVRFVSDLYASAHIPRTIGAGVTSIGIPIQGILSYRTGQ